MNKIELEKKLVARFPGKQKEESFGLPALYVGKEELLATACALKEEEAFDFSQLVCETIVDKKTCFELICHLRSIRRADEMILKTQIEREPNSQELPVLPSLYSLWQGAELFEDEIYDLFGIRFEHHPNLRRLFLDENFEGYPLRKDYVNRQE